MNNITTLIEKYQGLIKAETDYLASPEGQSSPEDQRMFATQKAFFYQQFVNELEKVNPWTKPKDGIPDRDPGRRYSQVACLCDYMGEICILMFNHEHMCWDQEDGDDYKCDIDQVKAWQLLPTAPTI